MLTKRIIPCLDIKNNYIVKGINFKNIKYINNPIYQAYKYSKDGADELMLLDISATNENRKPTFNIINDIAKNIDIPFTVGGGISSIYDVHKLLNVGVDKITINTSGFLYPKLINKLVKNFGSQCIVLSIDVKKNKNIWKVCINGGRYETNINVIDWVNEAVDRGVGEILLTSIDVDGTMSGFDIEIIKKLYNTFNIPIIASGGGGKLSDFYKVLLTADAAVGASVFHYNKISIQELKKYLYKKKLPIRL